MEPKLTREAYQLYRDYYMKMRNVESEGMITVTPRQLEGLIRLSTARSKLLLKEKVEIRRCRTCNIFNSKNARDGGSRC